MKLLCWILVILGIWLIISPFVVGYGAIRGALWNNVIVGIVVAVLSAWAAITIGKRGS